MLRNLRRGKISGVVVAESWGSKYFEEQERVSRLGADDVVSDTETPTQLTASNDMEWNEYLENEV